MNENPTIEKLDQLDRRVVRALEYVDSLKSECKNLKAKKAELEKQLSELIDSNNELSNQINNLKLSHEKSSKSFDKEEVRKKIDHMLEKFGELQL